MSLTLEHGPGPLNTIPMYHFFRPAPQLRHDRPPQPAVQVPIAEDVVQAGSSSQPEELQHPPIPETTAQGADRAHDDADSTKDGRKHRQIASNAQAAPACEQEPVLIRKTDRGPYPESVEKAAEEEQADSSQNERDTAPATLPVNVTGSFTSEAEPTSLPSSDCSSVQAPATQPRKLPIIPSPSKSRLGLKSSDGHLGSSLNAKMLCLSADGKLARSGKGVKSESNTKPRLERGQNLRLKNGRIVPSHRVILSYTRDVASGQLSVGQRIERILGSPRGATEASDHKDHQSRPPEVETRARKHTHPFFLRKARVSGQGDNELKDRDSTTDKGSDCESSAETQALKPWAAIKFSSSKFNLSRDISTMSPIWPPLSSQYHGHRLPQSAVTLSSGFHVGTTKQKHERIYVPNSEDILDRFRDSLSRTPLDDSSPVTVPRSQSILPKDLLTTVQGQQIERVGWTVTDYALQRQQRQLLHARSCFDRGLAAGPHDWAQKHAPAKTQEVLQPSVRELAAWMTKMKVHNVQSGLPLPEDRPRKVRRKALTRKRQDDLDDFIVSSDESTPDVDAPRNAILIHGPHGCGKTASVYAVANDLDFEIFELHPGMRRSAKDVFDRVGDMTANHLVRHSAPLRRPRNTTADEAESCGDEPESCGDEPEESTSRTQQKMTSFAKGPKRRMSQGVPARLHNSTEEKSTSKQKQSAILLEEVDILFDDDRSFWSGVQALIQQSKRPIVMTCNSLEAIPLDTLSLHAILTFEKQPIDDAVEYLAHVAALEGHLLDRSALATLYQSRDRDLRGALMDLNFWCQMTVGSKVGGLDWIPTDCHSTNATKQTQPRVISHGTFHTGLNLIPERPSTPEALHVFVEDQLGLPFLDLETARTYGLFPDDKVPLLAQLDEACAVSDARSCIDIADPQLGALLTTAVSNAFPTDDCATRVGTVASLVCESLSQPNPITKQEVALRLHPIMEDIRTFPPATGRTSACIDGADCAVVTEVAPYVRSIVAFDKLLQQRRLELNGGGGPSGKKQRTTRAARAAQEGGDKSSTRRERWFPKELDYDAVLQTRPRFFVEDTQF